MAELGHSDCICLHKIVKTMGYLYGVPLMGGRVRVADHPDCPIHFEECLDRMGGQWCHQPKGHDGPHSWGEA